MTKKIDIDKNREKYLTFVESRNNLILNLLDDDGKPFTSCAPFVKKDDKLYIYISKVAEHFRYMENNKWVDALLVADESATANAFATERARWSCIPKNIGNEGHEDVFDLFNAQYGSKLLDVLRGLDFSLFELTPTTGRYVVGFGMAFNTSISGDVFQHVVIDKTNKPGE